MKMPAYNCIDNVRALSQAQINKLTNAQLKEALGTVLDAYTNEEPSNGILLQEIRALKKEVEQIKTIQNEVSVLSSKLDQAFTIINQQQMFMESIDARERRRKIVIVGVPEGVDRLGDTDQTKIKTILNEAGYTESFDVSNWEIRRLGKEDNRKKRPILIVVEDQMKRNAILEKARNLKEKEAPLSSIYIKKDVHPAVRKELARLRKRERDERERPENQGVNIQYDNQRRVLLRDGEVIDRYTPSYF